MAVGANINYKGNKRLKAKILSLMGSNFGEMGERKKLCYKNGAPANNTAADNPNALYDMCYDATNSHLYLCTLYSANASATTWTQIV